MGSCDFTNNEKNLTIWRILKFICLNSMRFLILTLKYNKNTLN